MGGSKSGGREERTKGKNKTKQSFAVLTAAAGTISAASNQELDDIMVYQIKKLSYKNYG